MYKDFPLEQDEVEAIVTAFQTRLAPPERLRDGPVLDLVLRFQGMPTNQKLRTLFEAGPLLGLTKQQVRDLANLDIGLTERDMQFVYGWPHLHPDAMATTAGRLVEAILPYTEADKTALLINILGMFGMTVPRAVYFYAGGQHHCGNLFWCVVGDSKSGKKGTAHRMALPLFEAFYPEWAEHQHAGCGSGEALVDLVKDRREGETVNRAGEEVHVVYDEGARFKNVLIVDEEFEGTLITAHREGSTLSANLRKAWDGSPLEVLTRTNPSRANHAHICFEGHVTGMGLRGKMTQEDMFNGFGNRFLWLLSRRSKSQSESPGRPDYPALAEVAQRSWRFAQQQGEMRYDPEARALYAALYPVLEEELPGLVGAMSSRAASQICRMAMLFALLDCSPRIGVIHLRAAVAIMGYVVNTLLHVFGDQTGVAETDELLQHLRDNPTGILRREMHTLVPALKRDQTLLHTLADLKRYRLAAVTDPGTAREVWRPEPVHPFTFQPNMVGSAEDERRAQTS